MHKPAKHPKLITTLGYQERKPPRSRGKQKEGRSGWTYPRKTPALAGQTRKCQIGFARSKENPRARGANISRRVASRMCRGKPPRSRGKRPAARPAEYPGRKTPALAGQTSSAWWPSRGHGENPRARGANGTHEHHAPPFWGKPPRSRGKLPVHAPVRPQPGKTPALAGQTLTTG